MVLIGSLHYGKVSLSVLPGDKDFLFPPKRVFPFSCFGSMCLRYWIHIWFRVVFWISLFFSDDAVIRMRFIFEFLRRCVSKEKIRYTEDGFDLDLTCILCKISVVNSGFTREISRAYGTLTQFSLFTTIFGQRSFGMRQIWRTAFKMWNCI